MKNLTKGILSFIIGVGIGSLIETILTLVFKTYIVGVPSFVQAHSPVYVRVVQTLIYGGFGLVSYGLSMVYQKDHIPLLVQNLVHLGGLFVYFLFAGFTLHWYGNLFNALLAGILFFFIYLVIWTIFFFINKSKIQEINKKLH